jgi:gliding motility-associated-like protein
MKKQSLIILFILFGLLMNAQCWKEVACGRRYTLALKSDGTLWSWGINSSDQLGDGGIVADRNYPLQVGTATNWQSISASDDDHAKAIQSNGTLWGWGNNCCGQQGDGTFNTAAVPTQIGTDTDWKKVDGTWESTIALKTNGTLWAWGDNNEGQLGNGTQISSLVPIQVGTDTDWKSISAGNRHVLAVKNNGTLWAWGDNNVNQLGDGTTTIRLVPTQIGTDTDWQDVDAGWLHSSARKINGTLWTWGSNPFGGIGDGTTTNRSVPTLVSTANNFQCVSLGAHFTTGIKTNGELWDWGRNLYGQLGNSSNVDTYLPIQSGVMNNWRVVAAGMDHSIGIKTDGTIWAWGNNNSGQLGNGTIIDSNVPVEILSSSITVNSTSTLVCSGGSVTLTAPGTATYTWSGGVTNGVSFVPPSSNIYTVTGTDAIGCYNTATVAITVAPITTVTANATSTNVCTGGTVALTGSGATTYSWSGGVTDGQSFAPTATTSYTVSDGTGCSNTASITVKVIPLPVVSVNSPSICAGASALLTASATPAAGTTFSWTGSGTGNPLTVSPTVNTSYTVTATNTGCSSTAVASVSVVPVVIPVTGFSYPTPICTAAPNPLPTGATGFSPGGTYSSGAGLTIDPISGLVNLGTSTAGSCVVTYSVAANGCNPAGSSNFTITINAPTAAVTGFSYPSPVCAKDADPSPVLIPNFTTGGSFSAAGATINSANGSIDLVNTPAGTYTIAYAVNAANCVQAGTNSTTITIYSNPILSISSSTLIITGGQAILTANSSTTTYTWSPTTNLSCSTCASPTASPNETTLYCVQTTDGVCTNSACVTVSVESLCEGDKGLYLPNAFSPNNDGNNDVFCVQGTNRCITDFSMMIYDRWGEKLFESSDISFCWDGTYKGKVLNPDVYIYYVKAKDQYQKDLIKKGNVTLIK